MIQKAKDAGAIVMYTVGDAEAAKHAVDNGVDVIVAQGWEAGGHVRGMVATLPPVLFRAFDIAPLKLVKLQAYENASL